MDIYHRNYELLVGCEAMDFMNGIKNTSRIPESTRTSIGLLEKRFIHHLCEHKFCTSITPEPQSMRCHYCGGLLMDVITHKSCKYCQGAGSISQIRYGFRFYVSDYSYSWHLQDSMVNFALPTILGQKSFFPKDRKELGIRIDSMNRATNAVSKILESKSVAQHY